MPSSWRSDLLALHEWTGYAKNGDSRFEEGQEMKLQAAARDSSDRRGYVRTKSKSPVAAALY
jgi:hypothetical protein